MREGMVHQLSSWAGSREKEQEAETGQELEVNTAKGPPLRIDFSQLELQPPEIDPPSWEYVLKHEPVREKFSGSNNRVTTDKPISRYSFPASFHKWYS